MITWQHEPEAPIQPDHIGMVAYLGPLPEGDADTTPGFPGPGPQAYLVRHGIDVPPLGAHFHRVDQFQVFDRGAGRIGREEVGPGIVHYADAFTPYGPLAPAGADGMGYVTLRAEAETGIYYMPDRRDRLQEALAAGPRAPRERRSRTFDLRGTDRDDRGPIGAGPGADEAGWTDVEAAPDGLRVAVALALPDVPLVTPGVTGPGAFLLVLPPEGDGDDRPAAGWEPGAVSWLAPGEPVERLTPPAPVRLAFLQLPRPPAG